MTAQDVQTEILEPMQRMFTPRRHQMGEGDQQMALMEYVNILQQFYAVDLKEAWRSVLETYTPQVWPAPAVFASAARKARAERPRPQATPRPLAPSHQPVSRPIMWWCQNRKVWRPEWREDDIPEGWRESYFKRKALQASKASGSP